MTNIATVTVLDDERLIREGEAAVELYQQDLKNARLRIMPMARGLCAAKRRYPATQDFGNWLQTSSYSEIEKNDRAALIKIGEHEEFAIRFVRMTNLVSPQTIWDAIEELISIRSTSYDRNSTVVDSIVSESHETPPNSPAKTEIAGSENTKFDSVEIRPVSGKGRKSPLLGKPNADIVNTYCESPYTRNHAANLYERPKTRPIYQLLVMSIKEGHYGKPNDSRTEATNLSLVLPWLDSRSGPARKYDLAEPHVQKLVIDVIFPLLRERPELKADIYRFEREINARRVELEDQVRRQLKLEHHRMRLEATPLPANERPVIAYGVPLWPSPDGLTPRYTYDELCHACWYSMYFLDLQLNQAWRPMETAMAARHLTKYIEDLQPGFVQAVRDIFNAYQDQPDGERDFPSPPVNNQWRK